MFIGTTLTQITEAPTGWYEGQLCTLTCTLAVSYCVPMEMKFAGFTPQVLGASSPKLFDEGDVDQVPCILLTQAILYHRRP